MLADSNLFNEFRTQDTSRLRKKAFRSLPSLSVISPRGGELRGEAQGNALGIEFFIFQALLVIPSEPERQRRRRGISAKRFILPIRCQKIAPR